MKITSVPQLASMQQSRPATSQMASAYSQFASQSQQAEISITTKEGDTVSISSSFFSQQKASLRSYENGQSLLTAQAVTGKSDLLQIQGDLSPQELTDLSNMLGDLSQIAGDFFNGNLDAAAAGAMNIGDMGSLAKLDATFTNNLSLASTLVDYHPLPNSANDLFSNMLADAKDKPEPASQDGLSVTDRLQAQWQQFLSYLENQTGGNKAESVGKGQGDSPDKPSDIKDVGQAMLARVRQTLHNHPRLSPLVPAVGDLALNNARTGIADNQTGQNFIQDARHNFQDAFSGWML